MSSESLMRFSSRYSCWSSLRCRTILVLWPKARPFVRKRAPVDCQPVSLGTATLKIESQVRWCPVCWAGALRGVGREGHGPRPGEAGRGPRRVLSVQTMQYQQCSAVRRVWGASGVAGFLIFAPPTPPQNLIAGILSTHVRCTVRLRGWPPWSRLRWTRRQAAARIDWYSYSLLRANPSCMIPRHIE